jgi:hypothetical protein
MGRPPEKEGEPEDLPLPRHILTEASGIKRVKDLLACIFTILS